MRCYAREWRHYRPYFVCVYRWLTTSRCSVTLMPPLGTMLRSYHLPSTRSVSKNASCLSDHSVFTECVRFFFVRFIRTGERESARAFLFARVSILLFYYSACVHTILYFSLCSSAAVIAGIDFAFGFHFSSTYCVASLDFRIFRPSGRRFVHM